MIIRAACSLVREGLVIINKILLRVPALDQRHQGIAEGKTFESMVPCRVSEKSGFCGLRSQEVPNNSSIISTESFNNFRSSAKQTTKDTKKNYGSMNLSDDNISERGRNNF